MKIILAKTAGFCFGVNRAVNRLDTMIKSHTNQEIPIYSYGPVIHNPQVVNRFKDQGIIIINSLDELEAHPPGKILIRSHGISEVELTKLQNKGFTIIDSTCPYVKKIHNIVEKESLEGHSILIIGDENHPEVKGIAGWAKGDVTIIKEPDEIDSLEFNPNITYTVVAQTTFNIEKYKLILKKLQKKSIRVIINETVCQATVERQTEALELAKKVTKMIVIGGKNSSNTQKLYEICKSQCKDTYYIETIEELELNVFKDSDIIGITAGASTPKNIIEEVISNVRNAKF
jgi:4-hydroxy-3-methylbut-2-enyl diphosphate reductase